MNKLISSRVLHGITLALPKVEQLEDLKHLSPQQSW